MTRRSTGFVACLVLVLPTYTLRAAADPAGGVSGSPKKSVRSHPRPTPSPTKVANRSPMWPVQMRIDMKTVTKFDDKDPGRSIGATTTITVLTPALDPDGDPISYAWGGTGVGSTTGGLEDFQIKEEDLRAEGLSATWWRQNWSGEPASGMIAVTAKDGKGGEAVHLICIGRLVQCR